MIFFFMLLPVLGTKKVGNPCFTTYVESKWEKEANITLTEEDWLNIYMLQVQVNGENLCGRTLLGFSSPQR